MLTQGEIQQSLKDLGLGPGDHVLVHSSLSSLGPVEGGAVTVVDAFLEVLSPEGTLVVPTFGDFGAIMEEVKQRPGVVESIHPRASVAALGGKAGEICQEHWKAEMAHTVGTPYARIGDLGGYVCLLGVDQDRNTTLHAVESMLQLSYLNRTDDATFQTPEGEVTRSWDYFPGPHRDFIGLDGLLRRQGILKIGRIGRSAVRLMKSRETIDFLFEYGKTHPDFALCDNPNCEACIEQRADLFKSRWEAEDFTFAAAASLAGRYVPEMIEHCASVGIQYIELDALQGRPVQSLEASTIVTAVQELGEGGCRVTALRGYACTDIGDLFAVAAECGVQRVVLPLSGQMDELVEAASDGEIELSLYNAHQSTSQAYNAIQRLRSGGVSANLTYNGGNFARLGERPFHQMHRARLKALTDQLDASDVTFDGEPTELGRGNAEVKELISILRCSGFDGFIVLGADNRLVGDLRAAVDRFVHLIDTM